MHANRSSHAESTRGQRFAFAASSGNKRGQARGRLRHRYADSGKLRPHDGEEKTIMKVGRRQKAARQSLSARSGGQAAKPVIRGFCPLRTAQFTILTSLLLLLTAHCSLLTVSAQFSRNEGNSPLYSSRPYQPRAPIGLPKALNGVGIDQKLNEQLPLDLVLKNENGESVKLGDYFGKKPVVLSLVYYQCPMLCNQVLNGMVTAFKVMAFKPGEEFEVVTVSFDPRETPELAAAKKKTYVDYLPEPKRSAAASGWHFLTGDEASIKRITEAVGFRYHWDEATNQFVHASAIY